MTCQKVGAYQSSVGKGATGKSPEFLNVMICGSVTFLIVSQEVIQALEGEKGVNGLVRGRIQSHVKCLQFMSHRPTALTPEDQKEMHPTSINYYHQRSAIGIFLTAPSMFGTAIAEWFSLWWGRYRERHPVRNLVKLYIVRLIAVILYICCGQRR